MLVILLLLPKLTLLPFRTITRVVTPQKAGSDCVELEKNWVGKITKKCGGQRTRHTVRGQNNVFCQQNAGTSNAKNSCDRKQLMSNATTNVIPKKGEGANNTYNCSIRGKKDFSPLPVRADSNIPLPFRDDSAVHDSGRVRR